MKAEVVEMTTQFYANTCQASNELNKRPPLCH